MQKKENRKDQLILERKFLVDEFNKIQESIKDLQIKARLIQLKAFSCQERIDELSQQNDDEKVKEQTN